MKLRPCPFCGNTKPRVCIIPSRRKRIIVGYTVTCEPDDRPCGAHGPICNTKDKAVKGWQRRADIKSGLTADEMELLLQWAYSGKGADLDAYDGRMPPYTHTRKRCEKLWDSAIKKLKAGMRRG